MLLFYNDIAKLSQYSVLFDRAHEWVEDPTSAILVKEYMTTLLKMPISEFVRILVAMGEHIACTLPSRNLNSRARLLVYSVVAASR